MSNEPDFEIFLVATPGLEAPLALEVAALGWHPVTQPGGVTIRGGWPDVWRANLMLRGATRVLARIGAFRALHLAQLDKRARKFPWADVLRPDLPVRVETTCRASRIYHAGAATQRIERAIAEELGAPLAPDAAIVVKARIEDDLVTISLDTTGESLHKRGHKEAVAKAPMRETMAAMFLREMGFDGSQPVLDPMCGSGTFVIEAAEIAAGLAPGRSRGFAFEQLASFDPRAWAALRQGAVPHIPPLQFFGSDRDAGAIRMSRANAERAGVADFTRFDCRPLAELQRPEGVPGIVIVNPPYGTRIGNKGPLYGLHATMGELFRSRLAGWRVGLVTSEAALARATGLPLLPGPVVAHGGLKVRLWQGEPL
ncbi:THUMP domain-containing class I SAM-dependent RNA methyltransferase [Paracoccus siganidrum]|uniref:Class I SAM-dependent RNA methyltransferase n=1 Tax=Paracoccus siganidrum TaxID=1276757 RepID=A0A418ZV93_9RHOB|nr:class I SAM-dependent RNA methyltransferase [Paracoccus siganidrum]RJL03339.1 class I SAM-dependent RNA methyltransferase [Paracoccus siganidrum]RMC41096.1 class I SAM-dependent RNA methyltransferase [Paracoccus siganidrum]